MREPLIFNNINPVFTQETQKCEEGGMGWGTGCIFSFLRKITQRWPTVCLEFRGVEPGPGIAHDDEVKRPIQQKGPFHKSLVNKSLAPPHILPLTNKHTAPLLLGQQDINCAHFSLLTPQPSVHRQMAPLSWVTPTWETRWPKPV